MEFSMSHILHLDSSPRSVGEASAQHSRSFSRTLSYEFVTAWKDTHPGDTVSYRDLENPSIPHITEAWIAAAYSPSADRTPELQAAIRFSDELIDELLAADFYVMGIPMYNFTVPSVFKAYLDQVVRPRRTFSIEASGLVGLLKHKKILVITSQGGIYRLGTPQGAYNFHEPYLRYVFEVIGITDVSFIYADALGMGDEARAKSLAAARVEIQSVRSAW
jgi:FMN-dependent NADH-azoreductase